MPTSTPRSTRPPPRPPSGTPSRPSALGGRAAAVLEPDQNERRRGARPALDPSALGRLRRAGALGGRCRALALARGRTSLRRPAPLGRRVPRFVLVPGFFLVPWLLLPLAFIRGCWRSASRWSRSRCSCGRPTRHALQLREAARAHARLLVPDLLRGGLVGGADLARDPVRRPSRCGAARPTTSSRSSRASSTTSLRLPCPRRERLAPTRPARHPLLRALPRRRRAFRAPSRRGPGSRWPPCSGSRS